MENISVIADVEVKIGFSLHNLPPGVMCALEWETEHSYGKTAMFKGILVL